MQREIVDWKKRDGRRSVSLVGRAHKSAGHPFRVLITNLSYEGCTVISEQPLVVGETLFLEVPSQGRLRVQVRWIADDKAGVRFLLGVSVAEERRARLGV